MCLCVCVFVCLCVRACVVGTEESLKSVQRFGSCERGFTVNIHLAILWLIVYV